MYDWHSHIPYEGGNGLVAAVHECDWERLVNCGWDVALGVHPWFSDEWNGESIGHLREMLSRERVCAIGEIGLDYSEGRPPREIQLNCFSSQLELSLETGLPVVLHIQRGWEDFFDYLKHRGIKRLEGGICHGFTRSAELADRLFDYGIRISIGPAVLKSERLQRMVRELLPSGMVLPESDATAENGRGLAEFENVLKLTIDN